MGTTFPVPGNHQPQKIGVTTPCNKRGALFSLLSSSGKALLGGPCDCITVCASSHLCRKRDTKLAGPQQRAAASGLQKGLQVAG